jgi:PadR family transcriptional regulator PadR
MAKNAKDITKDAAIGAARIDLLQGTLDMLVLKVLAPGSLHGFEIAQRIHERSREALTVEEGSLYPALYRMQDRGWIKSEWGQSENNRRAKYYELTRSGRRQLEREADGWEKLCLAIGQVMESA